MRYNIINKMLKSFNLLFFILNLLIPQNCILCKQYKSDQSLCNECHNKLSRSENIGVPWIYAYYKYNSDNDKYNSDRNKKIHNNIQKIIHSIKYYNKKSLIYDIVTHIYKFYLEKIDEYIRFHNLESNDNSKSSKINKYILIPIPLSPDRQKTRGYNQSQFICEALLETFANNQMSTSLKYKEEETNRKINNLYKQQINFSIQNLLIRNKSSIKLSQTNNKDERIQSLEGVFAINPIFQFSGAACGRPTELETHNSAENNLYILIDDVTTTGATLYEARKTLVKQGIPSDHIMAMALAH